MNWVMRRFRPEQIRVFVLIFIVGGILLFFQTQVDGFISPRTMNRLQTSIAIITVVAVAESLVIITRNIDLSVGSIVGFAAYVVGTQLARNNDIPPLLVMMLAIGVGAVLGAVNGLLVSYGRVPAGSVVVAGSLPAADGSHSLYAAIIVKRVDERTRAKTYQSANCFTCL